MPKKKSMSVAAARRLVRVQADDDQWEDAELGSVVEYLRG